MLFLASAVLILSPSIQAADLAADPRLDKHVTFRTPAAPAKVALEGLARAAEVSLRAAETVGAEVLLLKVEDVPIREVMQRMARAAGASWVAESGTYFLTRTEKDEAKRDAAQHARIVASLTAEIARQSKAAAEAKPFDSTTAQGVARQIKDMRDPKTNNETGGQSVMFSMKDLSVVEARMPTGRLAARVIAQLDPNLIASAPPHRRTVFSTNPTRMELPLRLDVQAALGTYQSEQNLWADEMSNYSEDERMRVFYLPNGYEFHDHIKTTPRKINVVVNRVDNGMNGLGLEVQLYDDAGSRVGGGTVRVETDPPSPDMKDLMADPHEPKLTISDEDTTLMRTLATAMGRVETKATPLTDVMRAQLMRPDLHEPLARYPSNMLLQTAEIRRLNIVADLPDAYLFLAGTPAMTGMPTATSVLKLIQALPPSLAPVVLDDKWLEIQGGTAAPETMFANRADRVALSRLFGSAVDGALTVEGLAQYATLGKGSNDDFLFMLISMVLFPGSEFEGRDKWQTLQLIGALMHRQGGGSLKTGRIPFTALDPATINLIENIVFYQDTYSFVSRVASGGSVWAGGEPCEAMPRGLLPEGYLDVKVEQSDVLYTVGPRVEVVTASQLAWNTTMKNHPDKFGGGPAPYSTADKFRLGSVRRFTLSLGLTPDGASRAMSFEEKHVPTGNPQSFEGLPAAFQLQVKQMIDSYEQSFK